MNRLDALYKTLDSQRQVLASLHYMMLEEERLLMSANPDSFRLTSLSEDKQAALNTLRFLEEKRHLYEKQLTLFAPYNDQQQAPQLAELWRVITQLASQLQQQNQHTALLIKQQLAWTEQALQVLAPLQNQSFYGPDGRPALAQR